MINPLTLSRFASYCRLLWHRAKTKIIAIACQPWPALALPGSDNVLSIVHLFQTMRMKQVFFFGLFFSCSLNAAVGTQSLASINLQAENFLAEFPYESPYPAQFTLSKLDSRLKLSACDKALQVNFTHAQKTMGNTSLTIECQSPVNWQIHLPVRVDIYDDVLVTKIPLVKGQIIDTNDVQYRKHNITRLFQGFFRRADPLSQLQAKRNLAANTILNAANLSPRKLVTSGQQVIIVLNFKGIQVKSSGIALQSASRGELVKVRNSQSNKIVQGVVSGEGQISVQL